MFSCSVKKLKKKWFKISQLSVKLAVVWGIVRNLCGWGTCQLLWVWLPSDILMVAQRLGKNCFQWDCVSSQMKCNETFSKSVRQAQKLVRSSSYSTRKDQLKKYRMIDKWMTHHKCTHHAWKMHYTQWMNMENFALNLDLELCMIGTVSVKRKLLLRSWYGYHLIKCSK